ncbi:MAG TPA: response regulator transcription factor [Burkholderiales bacterium]|nr:response regulator transcription factor [Burkholderiales bacterium]
MPIRVFLIDDHRSILWGLEKLIDSCRPSMELVGSATNIAEALEGVAGDVADVVVLDLDLGQESGVEAIPQLAAVSKAKILILTGLRDEAVHQNAILAGARGVVGKESRAETILAAIAKVHEGEVWLDRAATGRLLVEVMRKSTARESVGAEQRRIAELTVREREIIALAAANAGATAKVIAEELSISEHTLRNHLTSIYEKLGVANRLELYAFAHQHRLAKPRPVGR